MMIDDAFRTAGSARGVIDRQARTRLRAATATASWPSSSTTSRSRRTWMPARARGGRAERAGFELRRIERGCWPEWSMVGDFVVAEPRVDRHEYAARQRNREVREQQWLELSARNATRSPFRQNLATAARHRRARARNAPRGTRLAPWRRTAMRWRKTSPALNEVIRTRTSGGRPACTETITANQRVRAGWHRDRFSTETPNEYPVVLQIGPHAAFGHRRHREADGPRPPRTRISSTQRWPRAPRSPPRCALAQHPARTHRDPRQRRTTTRTKAYPAALARRLSRSNQPAAAKLHKIGSRSKSTS